MTDIREILPGVFHWEALHAPLRTRVSSYYVMPAGIVLDPKIPDGGLDAFPGDPQQVVLTNGNHLRDGQQFAEHFTVPLRAPREAAEKLGDVDFEPYDDHDLVAAGVTAVHIGKLAPDEYALYLEVVEAIAFADALIHVGGALGFGFDELSGRDAAEVKDGLKQAFQGLLLREFDNLLFAHGDPMVGRAKEALRDFTTSPVGYEHYGKVL
jgi:hypothetical protein